MSKHEVDEKVEVEVGVEQHSTTTDESMQNEESKGW